MARLREAGMTAREKEGLIMDFVNRAGITIDELEAVSKVKKPYIRT